MKTCTSCEETKPESQFSKKGDYLQSMCRPCDSKAKKIYYRSKEGLIIRIYNTQKNSSKIRGHEMPPYSRLALRGWLNNQELFHTLFDNWVNSGFLKDLRPSCDRTDDNLGYNLKRLVVVTWKENKDKGHGDMRAGKLVHGVNPQKPVIGTNVKTEESKEYPSSNEAARQTGAKQANISACCLKKPKYKTAGGFTWKFKEQ